MALKLWHENAWWVSGDKILLQGEQAQSANTLE